MNKNVRHDFYDSIKDDMFLLEYDKLKELKVGYPPDRLYMGHFAHYKQDIEMELIEPNFKTYGDFAKITLDEFNNVITHDRSYVIFRFLPVCDNLIVHTEIKKHALKGIFDFLIYFANCEDIISNIINDDFSNISHEDNQVIFLYKLVSSIKRIWDQYDLYVTLFKIIYEQLDDKNKLDLIKYYEIINMISSQCVPETIYSKIKFNNSAIKKAKIFVKEKKKDADLLERLIAMFNPKNNNDDEKSNEKFNYKIDDPKHAKFWDGYFDLTDENVIDEFHTSQKIYTDFDEFHNLIIKNYSDIYAFSQLKSAKSFEDLFKRLLKSKNSTVYNTIFKEPEHFDKNGTEKIIKFENASDDIWIDDILESKEKNVDEINFDLLQMFCHLPEPPTLRIAKVSALKHDCMYVLDIGGNPGTCEYFVFNNELWVLNICWF